MPIFNQRPTAVNPNFSFFPLVSNPDPGVVPVVFNPNLSSVSPNSIIEIAAFNERPHRCRANDPLYLEVCKVYKVALENHDFAHRLNLAETLKTPPCLFTVKTLRSHRLTIRRENLWSPFLETMLEINRSINSINYKIQRLNDFLFFRGFWDDKKVIKLDTIPNSLGSSFSSRLEEIIKRSKKRNCIYPQLQEELKSACDHCQDTSSILFKYLPNVIIACRDWQERHIENFQAHKKTINDALLARRLSQESRAAKAELK